MPNIKLIDRTPASETGRPPSKKLEFVRLETHNENLNKIGRKFGGPGRHLFIELWIALGRYNCSVIGPLDSTEDQEDFFDELGCDSTVSVKVLDWLASRDIIDQQLWLEGKIIWWQAQVDYHNEVWRKRGKIPRRPVKTTSEKYEFGLISYKDNSTSESQVIIPETDVPATESELSGAETTQRKGKEIKGNKIKGKEGVIPSEFPSLEDVIKYFLDNGYARDAGIKFFEMYEGLGWIDTKNNPIKNWKLKAQKIWFKPEHLATPDEFTKKKSITPHSGFKENG